MLRRQQSAAARLAGLERRVLAGLGRRAGDWVLHCGPRYTTVQPRPRTTGLAESVGGAGGVAVGTSSKTLNMKGVAGTVPTQLVSVCRPE